MWQNEKQDSAIVRLALLLAIVTMPVATNLLAPKHILAQSATDASSFPLPTTMENGTTVRINGSSGLDTINQKLKESFEKQFSGTKVEVAANGSEAGLKGLLDGTVDIAALGRGLTPEEQAQGLEQVRLHRERIAIIVGAGNPFKGSLTTTQFARIFRGEITDWSQLGGSKGKIRFIDRPVTNDTRNTFRNYPAFKSGNFATGSTATQVADDNTAEIVKQLGTDGISYALANQVSQLPDVRVVRVHQTLPTDAKYPFSQPLVYAYKKNPSIGIAGFLGFAIAPPGQQAIEAARTAEADAIAQGELPVPLATNATNEATLTATEANVATAPTETFTTPSPTDNISVQREAPFWLLLPLLVIGVLGGLSYWWFFKRRSPAVEAADNNPTIAPGTGEAISSIEQTSNNSEVAWETEAPATVVNPAYPHLPEVPIVAPNNELPKAEVPPATTDVVSNAQNDQEQQPQPESNIAENITSIGGGAVAGTDANSEDNTNSIGNSNYSIWDSPDSELPVIETAANLPELPEIDEQTTDAQLPVIETAANLPELPEIDEQTTDAQLPVIETSANLPEVPDVSDVTLDAIADQAELTADETEVEIIEIVPHLPETTSNLEEDAANLAVVTDTTTDSTNANVEQESLIFRAHTPKWAYVLWQISDLQKQALPDGSPLNLRLYDVTNLDLSYQTPQLIEQYEVEELTGDRFVAIPLSDHDYMAEIGYLGEGDRWEKIARSEIVRVFSNPEIPEEETADSDLGQVEEYISLAARNSQTAYVSWQVADVTSPLNLRLYDVTNLDLSYQTPQLIEQYEVEELTGDRFVAIPLSDHDYMTEIGYLGEGDRWEKIARSEIVRVFSNPEIPEEETVDSDLATVEDRITLTARDSKSVDAAWQISDVNKQALQQLGCPLALRLYDVTGLDLSYQTPVFIAQYDFELTTQNALVAIPESDRDYIGEIGYATDSEHWVSIARSEILRVFSHPEIESIEDVKHTALINANDAEIENSISLTPRTAKWAYVCWHLSRNQKQVLQDAGISQLAVRLYDVTDLDLSYQSPQLVQQYECEEFARDRFVAIPVSDHDYITELGYITDGDRWVSIVRSPIVRIFSRPYPDFWFVADAEIIIHGATEPDANVNIAGHDIKLKPDGTFHLRIPFSDSLIEYLMTATSGDGEQTRTIHKKFSQDNLET